MSTASAPSSRTTSAALPALSVNVQNAALLAIAYFSIASAGHALSPGDDSLGFFWLPAGLLLATLLLAPRHAWSSLLLGAFVGDAAFGLAYDLAPTAILHRFGGTLLASVVGAVATLRFVRQPFELRSSRELLWFLFWTTPVATLLGALVGVTLDGLQSFEDFERMLWPRWGSNAMGVLVLAPHMLAWSQPLKPRSVARWGPRFLEGVLLVAAMIASVVVVFVLADGISSSLRILLAGPVVWAGLRFGLRGVTTVCLALSLPVAFFTGAAMTGDVATLRPEATGAAQTLIALIDVIGLMLALVIQESREQLYELGRSQGMLRAVVEDQTEMIIRWNPDGTRTFVNEAYCRGVGASSERLLGSSFAPHIPESDWAYLQGCIRALTPEHPVAIALQQDRKGSDVVRWQEWTHRGIFDADGQLAEVQSTGRDITQRLTDEKKIRRLSRLYASLSGVNHAVLAETDADSFLVATCRILVEDGGLVLAAIGRADFRIGMIEPVARAGAASSFLDTIEIRLDATPQGQGPAATCIRENRPYVCNDFEEDPRTAPWREQTRRYGIAGSASFPIRNAEGVWGVLALYTGETNFFDADEIRLLVRIADNISFALENFAQERARRATELALRESERRFRLAMEYSPIGMAIVASDGRWIDVNPSLCRIVGYEREELLTLDFQTITHPEDLHRDLELMQQVLAGRRDHYQLEKRYIRKDGATIWIQLDVVLMRLSDPADSYFLSKIQDITARKDAERKILELNANLEKRVVERTRQIEVANRNLELANRELELANRELEAFSASVSHDLRSPLRLIEGFAQMLSNGHIDPLDSEGLEDLARIRSAARRMDERINGMLRLARLTRGPLQRDHVDLSMIANETIETLADAHRDREVRVTIEPGLAVRGSTVLLRAVMENLLGNAWKFTARTADAEISFGRRLHGGEPMFFVHDNGAGFSMEYADQLFRAFRRLHDEDDFPGTGIGLVTVQRIVQRYGGRIEIDAAPGKGACFYFTIPDRGDEASA